MKSTHLVTPRTLDQCQFTYPHPIERYRRESRFAAVKFFVVVALCVYATYLLAHLGMRG